MTISIVNHKGGTGKTTTTVNLGSALAADGYRVLLVDFDAQGSLSYSLGISDEEPTIADALLGEIAVQKIVREREGMDILPASSSLADVELTISKSENYLFYLKDLLAELSGYDFILIDCPPSLSVLSLNALTASDYIIVPMQMDVLALRGLDSMLDTIKKLQTINPMLKVLGVLPVMADMRKNIYQEIKSLIETNYAAHLFRQSIHINVKAAEAPSFGLSVINYAPTSTVAIDYREFAQEVLTLTKKSKHNI